jgi:hypothetical protein
MRSIISRGMSERSAVHFGGPDLPPRRLRDLLRERIDAVPAGGEIAWATYYFRDRDLAAALIAASDRGVTVTLQVEGRPRRKSANAGVLAMLEGHGLRGGLKVHRSLPGPLHAHLHSKIYTFSHPAPTALVGSFNPSGDVPECPDVIAEIGDQDRGHNLLVEFSQSALPLALRDHVRAMHKPLARLRNLGSVEGNGTRAWFYPRLHGAIAERAIARAGRISGCISHLKPGALTSTLISAARKGASVRLIVHDTGRRVPEAVISELVAAGVDIRRFVHPEGLPMHAKFLLADDTAWFGSFNFNPRSRWLNREVLLASRDEAIVAALAERFEQIASA